MSIERAVIYARVSKAGRDGTSKSVDEQLVDCRAECARQGWPVGEEVDDRERGASEWSPGERPGFRKLFQVLRRGDVLVVWELSRLARNDEDRTALAAFCKQLDIPWHYAGRTYDAADPDDAFTLDINHAVSKKESAQTRKRVLRSLKENAKDGKWHGRTIYGYRAVRDPDTGRITERVPDESTAPIVREAADRVLKGESLRSIGLDFQSRGLLTANGTKRWHGYTIRNMVMNPAYAGKRVHKGQLSQGNWEPILTEDEHVRLKAVLTDPVRTAHIPRGTPPRYLLSGIALCGVCRKPLYKHENHGRAIYKCSGRPSHMARELAKVNDVVTERMLQMIEDYRIELFYRSADPEDDDAPAVSAVGEHLTEARELQQRLDAFYDQAAEGELSPAALARIEARLLPKIEAAKSAAESAARVSDPAGRILDTPAEKLWESWTLDEKRDFIRSAAEIVMLPATTRAFERDRIQITARTTLNTRPEGFEHFDPSQ